jgi:hypothetical protein
MPKAIDAEASAVGRLTKGDLSRLLLEADDRLLGAERVDEGLALGALCVTVAFDLGPVGPPALAL